MNRLALALAVLVVLALTGCSNAGKAPAGVVAVVASTDVWGDVASEIGGEHVQVTSILDSPSRDPHDYQADVRDQLEVLRAQVVIENGGGYDDFMDRLRRDNRAATVLNATALSGYDARTVNEHLWYDLPTVGRMARAIAAALESRDPAHEADYRAALKRFDARLDTLEGQEAAIRRTAAGRGVAVTEPVPLHLTAACGLVDRTPEAFSSAVEDGRDVAPAVLQQQLALLRDHRVALLAVNEQTTEPTTDRVVAVARAAGVPVVGFRETLPAGEDTLSMIHGELAAVGRAVAR